MEPVISPLGRRHNCSMTDFNVQKNISFIYISLPRDSFLSESRRRYSGVCRYRVRLPAELRQSSEPTQQDHRRQQRPNAAAEELRYVLETNRSHSGFVCICVVRIILFSFTWLRRWTPSGCLSGFLQAMLGRFWCSSLKV